MVTTGGFGADRLQLIASLESSHFWFVARRILVERLLGSTPLTEGHRPSAVDIGCGTGSLAVRLAERGFAVLALDRHAQGLHLIHAAGAASTWVVCADATALPVADGIADLAVALDVLEHTDDESVVQEMARILKPGARVVVTVPAFESLWSARDDEAGHQRRYTRRGIVGLLTRAHLDVVDVRFYQCLLLPVMLVTRVLGKRWSGTARLEERPPGWVNSVCLAINRCEIWLGDYISWPWGSSIAVVAHKRVLQEA